MTVHQPFPNAFAHQRPALTGAVLCALSLASALPAHAHIRIAYSLGRIIKESSNVIVLRIEDVDRQKNIITYRKVRDIKSTDRSDVIRHQIGKGTGHPREQKMVMAWARPGKTAVFFHNGGAGELCLHKYWYQVRRQGNMWQFVHGEPFFQLAFCGRPDRIATVIGNLLTGGDAVVPCMALAAQEVLHECRGRMQRMRVSMSLQDYNQKRDFVGWGVDEFQRIDDMPAFASFTTVDEARLGARGVAPCDFTGDGNPDLCLYGETGVRLLENAGESFNEVALPVACSARAAEWADANSDGKPDLLLATPHGPRLFLRTGDGFDDFTHALPSQEYNNLLGAAWIDFDGDALPDVLLADGFHGLRLYRNRGPQQPRDPVPAHGPWHGIGPFPNPNGNGFARMYPPELEVDLDGQYIGANGTRVKWEVRGPAAATGDLAPIRVDCRNDEVTYLFRLLDFGGTGSLDGAFSVGDSLAVWLNGEKIFSDRLPHPSRKDGVPVRLDLRSGKNTLLLKLGQRRGVGTLQFTFKTPASVRSARFEDISDRIGLGLEGIAADLKGGHVAVADVNGDKKQDFLYSAGTGVLAMNTGSGFVEARHSGISYPSGGVRPAFGDCNGDRHQDLFVPQKGTACRLFLNDGTGRFRDATGTSGELASASLLANCAVWTDFVEPGRPDLLIGCSRGPNRYFRNDGRGTFTEISKRLGLQKRIFNTHGLAVLDLNVDGAPDLVLHNEGQKPVVLLGSRFGLARPSGE